MSAAPRTIDALVDAVTATTPRPVLVAGYGTKRPAPAGEADATRLDLRQLTGLTAYDPAECVVTVRAGTPVSEVAQTLALHGQYLPWDPPLADDGASVGGMIAAGLSGPGRLRYGGVRDFIIGATVVDGRGRRITSGGQVVKNAAGFLLHHALVGSAGRLGAIAEVSLKVFPQAPASCTLVAGAASRADLLAAHERLRLAALDLDALDLDLAGTRLLARVTGTATALPTRVARAARLIALATDTVVAEDERAVWQRQARAIWHGGASVVKVPLTPSRLPELLDRLTPFGALHVSVAGSVAYLTTSASLDDIDTALLAAPAPAAVVRGAGHGRRLGVCGGAPFLDRVRATLDPDNRLR